MPALTTHSGSSSKPLMMFGTDGTGTLTSPSNQLVRASFVAFYWQKELTVPCMYSHWYSILAVG